MMNPYQRGHTWNPYNCGSGGGGGLPGSSGLTGGPGGGGGGGFLPNRIATLSDVKKYYWVVSCSSISHYNLNLRNVKG